MDSGGVQPSLPSAAAAGGTSVPDEPRDARVVRELLRSMGLGEGEYEPRVAIQAKVNFSFSQPPPREVLLELARSRNKIPLPKSIAPPGSIPLPPKQDTLLSENYQLLPALKPPAQTEETKVDNEGADAIPANPSPNYSQDQRSSEQHQPHSQSQRVSFQLNAVAAAAAKRPLVTIDQLNMG
ncbi:hypothetical protein CFC21_043144 [Triticum aestivum]|uniref:Uncharacterized protein n=2 Tax=Triticum aestivum TaxID=4565 RepID=A0A3B6FXL5_WHEAT|nr:hypothetical protein CFC21_043144 [Triticum aestivum]